MADLTPAVAPCNTSRFRCWSVRLNFSTAAASGAGRRVSALPAAGLFISQWLERRPLECKPQVVFFFLKFNKTCGAS